MAHPQWLFDHVTQRMADETPIENDKVPVQSRIITLDLQDRVFVLAVHTMPNGARAWELRQPVLSDDLPSFYDSKSQALDRIATIVRSDLAARRQLLDAADAQYVE